MLEIIAMASFLLVFAAIWAVGYFVFWRAYGDDARALARLRDIGADAVPEKAATAPATGIAEWLRSAFPRLGALMLPPRNEQMEGLKRQLAQAGLYRPNALKVILGVKLALMGAFSFCFGLLPFLFGLISLQWAMLLSVVASAAGLMAPNVWLYVRIDQRRRQLRAGLADALDMLVLCIEGGLSMNAALQRITGELVQVHPALGDELTLVVQTVNLGLSVGEAVKQFGERSGLEEVRDLAALLLQSERFGAGVAKTLRTHADASRTDRQHRAEERAQKASVKILFPMLLFIFPAIFIVLLGPAAFQVAHLFAK